MKIFCLIMVLLYAGCALAELPEEPEKDAFAWGITLQPDVSSPFYQLDLPLAVYQGVARADLGDLRMFNGKGHRLPHDLTLPSRHLSAQERIEPVTLFPLYGTRAADLQLLSLRISRQGPEGAMTLEQRQFQRTRDEVLRGYLLQLWQGEQRPAIQRLKLQWPEQSQGFIQRLKLEQSDDLAQWRPLTVNAVIADLSFAGERLIRGELPLAANTARFVRLTPQDEAMVELKAIQAVVAEKPPERPQATTRIGSVHPGMQAGEYLFQLPGRLPVVEINLIPAEPNTITRATLYSRATEETPWVRRASGTLYRLSVEETPLQQTALSLDRISDLYWKLVVDEAGGGLGEQLPTVQVSWIPHRLRFAARGEGPFMLAYGSALAGPNPPGPLLSDFSRSEQQRLVSERITAGQPFELAGPAALTARRVYDWKQWSLWGVLTLSTLLLGWMAWTTLRQISIKGSNKGSESNRP